MDFDLTGRTVLAVRLDGTILHVDLDPGWLLTIENDYEFADADGRVLRTASGEEPLIVTALSTAIGTPLTSFSYTEDGHLSFAVVAGEVRVEPLSRFESWQFVGPNKGRVICTPGGGLAIWS